MYKNLNHTSCILLLLLLLLISFTGTGNIGCSSATTVNNKHRLTTNTSQYKADTEYISHLTDTILIDFACHNYKPVNALLDSQSSVATGTAAALRLLGSRAFTVILDRWDATKIKVSFSHNPLIANADTTNKPKNSHNSYHNNTSPPLWAVSSVVVFYKFAPNRQSLHKVFTFRFHRARPEMPWRLFVP